MDISTAESRNNIHHVLIMVHGIRDFGEWQEELGQVLPDHGIATVGIRYGYFDVFRFLFPFSRFRQSVIDSVARNVRDTQDMYPNAQFSYLAHSFGTYVVGRMLLDDPGFTANRIVFCGSVLSPEFPVSRLRANFNAPLINEIGTRDIWPTLAANLTWGYGTAGVTGFGQPYVKDRFHDHGHSEFLSANFARKFWVPFLTQDQIVQGIVPAPMKHRHRLLFLLNLKYVLMMLGIIVFSALAYYRPDLHCSERWLDKIRFLDCFARTAHTGIPASIEGRRSWFGVGEPVFKADIKPVHGPICFQSRIEMPRPEFEDLNRFLTGHGYLPISVGSFVSMDNSELFQAVWKKIPQQGDSCNP